MPAVISLDQIKEALETVDPLPLIEEGFVAYSKGDVVVPPVGEMILDDPPGEVHIKYGYIKGGDYYVIKIASGFYDNPKLGLPSGDGLMLLYNQKTGELLGALLDRGHLTNVRTAAAGAVAAKYLAPRDVTTVGILGAGVQGRMQLEYLRGVRSFEEAVVWGIDEDELVRYRSAMEPKGFRIRTTLQAEDVAMAANLIVTCTPSKSPLLEADWIRPGTHITAVGSDTPEKQELEARILEKADRVVVDSLSQSELRGEVFKAVGAGRIRKEDLVELGRVIDDEKYRRQTEDEITVADLTGVAVQDIQITTAIWNSLGVGPR